MGFRHGLLDRSGIGSVPQMADHYLATQRSSRDRRDLPVLATLVAAAVRRPGSRPRRTLRSVPARLGRTRPPGETPVNALFAMTIVGSIIDRWLCHVAGRRSDDRVGLYAECSTMGTILILFVYVLTSWLPVFIRHHAGAFSPSKSRPDAAARAALAVRSSCSNPASRCLQHLPLRRSPCHRGERPRALLPA
jgi:hypothetical protein